MVFYERASGARMHANYFRNRRSELADWGGGGGAREIEHQPHAMSQPSDLTIFRASRINDRSRRRCSLASAVKWPCR